eukprot:scaffold13706_cov121-Isochrysis_galbana.AAC.13
MTLPADRNECCQRCCPRLQHALPAVNAIRFQNKPAVMTPYQERLSRRRLNGFDLRELQPARLLPIRDRRLVVPRRPEERRLVSVEPNKSQVCQSSPCARLEPYIPGEEHGQLLQLKCVTRVACANLRLDAPARQRALVRGADTAIDSAATSTVMPPIEQVECNTARARFTL